MKIKSILLAITLLLAAALVITGCAADEPPPSEEIIEDADIEEEAEAEEAEPEEEAEINDEAAEEKLFTMEEIAQFDGKDGQPAYIVVDGVVYDVSNVAQWGSGSHFGFEAGQDVSDALGSAAPHGAAQLNNAEIVGRLAE